MKAGWMMLGALLVAAPLAAQEPPSEAMKRMTPEERALAQRKLNAAASMLYDIPLDSAKTGLRSLLMIMRDSLMVVQTEASRVQRASSPAVATSAARRLRVACGAASRVMIGAEPHIAGMKASAKAGAEALIAYQKALGVTYTEMTKCDRAVALQLASPTPGLAQLRTSAVGAEAAAVNYDQAADGLLRVFDIPMRPKGVPGGL
ncbi:MAG: hypothetical protein IPJ11_00725 [Gemmatimonadetes bacterium]|nr:hypothetical protein [Gemmatimonadota bacterium]